MLRVFLIALPLALTGCWGAPMSVLSIGSSPDQAYALESIEGLKEGSWRANRLMGVDTRRVPWCGHAVKYAVEKSGGTAPKHYASARAWEDWGSWVPVSQMSRGDVVVFKSRVSRSGRHVAIASAVKGDRVRVCGGNTRNKVHCGWRSKSRIVTVRR